MLQARGEFALEEDRRNSHAHGTERSAVQLQRQADIVDCGRAVDHTKLVEEASVAQAFEVGAWSQDLSVKVGIAVQQRAAIKIQDRRVIHDRHVANGGIEQVVEIGIGFKVSVDCRPDRFEVVRVNFGAGEIRDRVARGIDDLLCQQLGDIAAGIQALAEELGNIEIGKRRHHDHHHEGDGENDFRFPTHVCDGLAFQAARPRGGS